MRLQSAVLRTQDAKTYISAEQPETLEDAWFSFAYGNEEWAEGAGAEARSRAQEIDRERRARGPVREAVALFLEPTRRLPFSKKNRLLKRSEFRKVYDEGSRVSAASFLAFCWNSQSQEGPRFGFTATKATGKSVSRNLMRRRLREQIRLRLWQFPPEWWIVLNLKRSAQNVPAATLAADVERLLDRCVKSS